MKMRGLPWPLIFLFGDAMRDSNWELINGEQAHEIEQLNNINTINVIEAMVRFLIAHRTAENVVPHMPNELALRELHRTGTLFLLARPGEYRTEPVVCRRGTEVVYAPPPPEMVPELMQGFFKELEGIWNDGDALDVAAFVLWRVNWIHPFKNGNGRTARAFSYACLSARLGVILPGKTTIIAQVMNSREVYEACLQDADKAAANNDGRNLKSMRAYLDDLLQRQIASTEDGLDS